MVDYQIVVNTTCNILAVSFPIAFVFIICQKIISSFLGVVFGKDINF